MLTWGLPSEPLTNCLRFVGPGHFRFVGGTCRMLRDLYVQEVDGSRRTTWTNACESNECALLCYTDHEEMENSNQDVLQHTLRKLVLTATRLGRPLPLIEWAYERGIREQAAQEKSNNDESKTESEELPSWYGVTFVPGAEDNDAAIIERHEYARRAAASLAGSDRKEKKKEVLTESGKPPGNDDVLLGRGYRYCKHNNKTALRKLIMSNYQVYGGLRLGITRDFASKLADIIKSKGHRFLEERDGVWKDAKHDQAVAKTMQLLRDESLKYVAPEDADHYIPYPHMPFPPAADDPQGEQQWEPVPLDSMHVHQMPFPSPGFYPPYGYGMAGPMGWPHPPMQWYRFPPAVAMQHSPQGAAATVDGPDVGFWLNQVRFQYEDAQQQVAQGVEQPAPVAGATVGASASLVSENVISSNPCVTSDTQDVEGDDAKIDEAEGEDDNQDAVSEDVASSCNRNSGGLVPEDAASSAVHDNPDVASSNPEVFESNPDVAASGTEAADGNDSDWDAPPKYDFLQVFF